MVFSPSNPPLFFCRLSFSRPTGDPVLQGGGRPRPVHGPEQPDGGGSDREGRLAVLPRLGGGVLPGLPRHPPVRIPGAPEIQGTIYNFFLKHIGGIFTSSLRIISIYCTVFRSQNPPPRYIPFSVVFQFFSFFFFGWSCRLFALFTVFPPHRTVHTITTGSFGGRLLVMQCRCRWPCPAMCLLSVTAAAVVCFSPGS